MTAEAEFVRVFTATFPELHPLLAEHLAEHEGELLSYLLIGDVAAWMHRSSTRQPGRVSAMSFWLERQYRDGSFDVQNLIDVGIVEMLPGMPDGVAVLNLLGPALRARAEVAGLFAT